MLTQNLCNTSFQYETILKEIISTAVRLGFIKAPEWKKVNLDTTLQEKNIRFPTDARLYDRLRERLVKEAKLMGVELRQSYERVAKKALHKQSWYARWTCYFINL